MFHISTDVQLLIEQLNHLLGILSLIAAGIVVALNDPRWPL